VQRAKLLRKQDELLTKWQKLKQEGGSKKVRHARKRERKRLKKQRLENECAIDQLKSECAPLGQLRKVFTSDLQVVTGDPRTALPRLKCNLTEARRYLKFADTVSSHYLGRFQHEFSKLWSSPSSSDEECQLHGSTLPRVIVVDMGLVSPLTATIPSTGRVLVFGDRLFRTIKGLYLNKISNLQSQIQTMRNQGKEKEAEQKAVEFLETHVKKSKAVKAFHSFVVRVLSGAFDYVCIPRLTPKSTRWQRACGAALGIVGLQTKIKQACLQKGVVFRDDMGEEVLCTFLWVRSSVLTWPF